MKSKPITFSIDKLEMANYRNDAADRLITIATLRGSSDVKVIDRDGICRKFPDMATAARFAEDYINNL